jgi:hypothetical protein
MQFRVTARDHRAGGGLTASAEVQVIVTSNAGPFRFTSPLTTALSAGPQTITWDVAGTASAPINALNVEILLSTDGGQTFPIVLASNAPNAGIKTINLPALPTSTARFQIRAADNIFFCVSPANFSISPTNSNAVAVVTPAPISFQPGAPHTATLSWPATPGTTYRIQYKNGLASGGWTNLQPDITATESIGSFSISTADAPQRFFRLLILP